MITNTGREQHLKLISGKAVRFADRFVVGSSNAPLDPSNTELDFAWGECLVSDSFIDKDNNQVIFYGTLPSNFSGEIREIGLATMDSDFIKSGRNINISFYFAENELWNCSDDDKFSYVSEASLMGDYDVKITGASAGEKLSKPLAEDISEHTSVKLRVYAEQASSMTFNLYNTESSYASYDFNLDAGENLVRMNIEDAVVHGSYNNDNVQSMELVMNTPGDYTFDAIVFSGANHSGLVTRSLVAVPKRKLVGNTMELEYAVMLNA